MYRRTKAIGGRVDREYRHIMAAHLGRRLASDELVHHIDGDIDNNNISNLKIVSRSEHKKIHNDIGRKTRFKKKYFFDIDELISDFKKNGSVLKMSKNYDCSEATIRRTLKTHFNCKTIREVKRKMAKSIYRQGDTLLKPIKAVPTGAKKKEGRTIALGEATGHHHTFRQETVQLFEHEGKTIVEVAEPSSLEHQEHNALVVQPGVYQLIIEREKNHFTGAIEQVQD